MGVAKKRKNEIRQVVMWFCMENIPVQTDKASGPVEIHQIHGFPLRTDKDLRQDRQRNIRTRGFNTIIVRDKKPYFSQSAKI